MTLKNKKFTIYPSTGKSAVDKADGLVNFIVLRATPLLGEEGKRFVKNFSIIKNADLDDESIYCDVTFDVDELLAINDAYIELEIKDLVDVAVRRFPVSRLASLLTDENLIQNVKQDLMKKIFDFIRTLKTDFMFRDDDRNLK